MLVKGVILRGPDLYQPQKSKAFDGKSALGCNVSLVQRLTADGLFTCPGK